MLAIFLLSAAAVLITTSPGVEGAGATPSALPSTHAFPTPIRHVLLIMLENAARSTVVANGPFEVHLAKVYASASQYYAVCHPSAPNYLAITSGAAFQCGSDGYAVRPTENLGDLAQRSGLSWAGFEESMPKPCDLTNTSAYAVKHNPFVYYPDIVHAPAICQTHDLPFTNFTYDVAHNAVPNLAILTPNLTDDGHNTGVAYADHWLKGFLSPLLNDSFFAKTVVFVAYDESVNDNTGYNGTAGGHVYLSAVSPYARAGYGLGTNASHYNLLTTMEWLLGLGPTSQNDTWAKWPPMRSMFTVSPNLTAHASVASSNGTAPVTLQFHGSASGGRAPYRYDWNFGGSANSSQEDPQHTYRYAGSYTATLQVTDYQGAMANASVRVVVARPGGGFTATAAAWPSGGAAPFATTFSANDTGGTGPYSDHWDFGDGTNSSSTAPSHTFARAGTYPVQLQVVDAHGRTSTSNLSIPVSAPVKGLLGQLGVGNGSRAIPSHFFSVVAQTACVTCLATDGKLDAFLAASPFDAVRYGQSTDYCNISVDRLYSDAGSYSLGCGYSIATLKTWCNGLSPHCTSIIDLPGENNRSAEDAAIASWIVLGQGFQPTYWSIGNEPQGWTHYGIPWSQWKTSDHSRATPVAYAFDVKAAMAAVTGVDPAAKFIGIQAACSCNTLWFQDVAKIDGAALSAVAFHEYPSEGTTSESLAQFFAPLQGTGNLSASVARVRAAVAPECSRCPSLPIFVNEYNAGPGWAPSNFAGSYANAVFLAASVVQGLTVPVAQLSVFELQTYQTGRFGFAMVDAHDALSPPGVLFADVLPRLALGTVSTAPIATTLGNVWAVTTANATSESLIVVNANLTNALALHLGLDFPSLLPGTVLQWSPGHATPSVTHTTLAGAFSVPSQGILVLTVALPVPAPPPTPPAPGTLPTGAAVAGGVERSVPRVGDALGALGAPAAVLLAPAAARRVPGGRAGRRSANPVPCRSR
ncbi:MAG: PKD domain-containing protein [Thermoplasmata archaeon]|nr:PKD domain-containing protein [Thermoplasmata archaeon]